MKLTGIKTVTICPWAVREGVLLRYIENGPARWTAIAERGGEPVTTGRLQIVTPPPTSA